MEKQTRNVDTMRNPIDPDLPPVTLPDALCGTDDQVLVAAALGLGSFGIAYAGLVNWAERTGVIEGKSSLFVAFGTLVTVAIRQVMPSGFVYDLAAFVFSGTPMIVNQLENHRRDKARARRREKGVWHNNGSLNGLPTAGQKKPGTRPRSI